MLKSITLIFLLTFAHTICAQNDETKQRNGKIGISYSSFGENDMIHFQESVGSASYTGDYFFSIGANYLWPIKPYLDLECGLEYGRYDFMVHPNLPPDMDNSPSATNLSLLSLPLGLRLNFLRFFYLNGGVFLGFETTSSHYLDSQSGFGAMAGLGVKYDFRCGASLFVNPYLKAHSLIPFSLDDNHQRLMESGVRFGVYFRL